MRENPFATEKASSVEQVRESFAGEVESAFRNFVMGPGFPCVGAKAALNSGSCTLRVYEELGSDSAARHLSAALYDFNQSMLQAVEPSGVERSAAASEYATFVAIFERPRDTDEIKFEDLFWKQLRALHDYDATRFGWDPHVSSDPADPHFSFSFAGQALYVIGLHANSSRDARRFPWPTLIFNPHEQFERLRADGKWKRMQETIRSRDLELQGSINPMLSDFGEQSEARQYSGRAVGDDWEAPFKPANSGGCPFHH